VAVERLLPFFVFISLAQRNEPLESPVERGMALMQGAANILR